MDGWAEGGGDWVRLGDLLYIGLLDMWIYIVDC